jgi:hypothetical protein
MGEQTTGAVVRREMASIVIRPARAGDAEAYDFAVIFAPLARAYAQRARAISKRIKEN